MPFNGRDVSSRDTKTNQTTFSHISLFWKHILKIFGDTPRNCTSMIIELQPSQIYFAFTQNQKLICNGEMQNRCRVQLLAQINIFLLKKEHLSATNQSSSCNYSFDCKFFFFQKVHLSFLFFKKYISLWPIELLVAHINQSLQRSERLQWAKVESKYIFLFWTNICFFWQIYILLQRHIFSQNKYMFFSGQYITLDICQEE